MCLTSCACVVVALTVSAVGVATAAPPPSAHTRPLTPGAASMLTDAIDRSPVVAELVEALERTDVVVLLTDSIAGWSGEPATHLGFVSYAAGLRYVLVRIDRWRLSPIERIIGIGHELQHALEVAAAPDVTDAAGLTRLYRQIGFETNRTHFETTLARTTADRVRNELDGHGGARRTGSADIADAGQPSRVARRR